MTVELLNSDLTEVDVIGMPAFRNLTASHVHFPRTKPCCVLCPHRKSVSLFSVVHVEVLLLLILGGVSGNHATKSCRIRWPEMCKPSTHQQDVGLRHGDRVEARSVRGGDVAHGNRYS